MIDAALRLSVANGLLLVGSDLGSAFRGFKNAMNDKEPVEPATPPKPMITAEDSERPPATDTAERKTESSKEA